MKIYMPSSCKNIINTFYNNGYEAFIVGGCVRDALMGRKANDYDITTNSTPDITIKLFENTHKVIVTGEKHGTITLIDKNDGEVYEVTTYRIDGEYKDSRRPENVEFTSSLREDLLRRDFTINAMAYNERLGLVDYFNGGEDLNNKIIKCVGNPEHRFNEDALRILRALRFKAQLNFDIDNSALESIKILSYKLNDISVERIREEFNKMILSNPYIVNDLYKLQVLEYILPELKLIYDKFIGNESIINYINIILNSVNLLNKDICLRYALLLHGFKRLELDYRKESYSFDSNKILKRLKYDNKTINKVDKIIEYLDITIEDEYYNIKKILNSIGEDVLRSILKIKKIEHTYLDFILGDTKLENILEVENKLNNIIENSECYSIKDLKITGNDIINIGCAKGKKVGEVLEMLLEMVLRNPDINSHNRLLCEAKKIIN
ncbi:CCA tRNA nucleotidyltransferase [Clostridium cylindrosporum]|uniref:tRNA nucleotidyltransferase/poly(A) polymerase n=1 Tax=Clostridium cylindrosporum DSM 605 TaxID=1121307 RepID=A0A0J8D516_CLOCY|nr:[cytidine(C)-cytidine(C)-adenosine (A)]-adding enzyme [Clostridium cylindrosporum]KMT21255.1 tRNA nucleotidyltransferase/poly(A) polymerase [Clostridium cylindrosporum DSM 605]